MSRWTSGGAEFAAVTDLAALEERFRSAFETGDLQAAVRVQERILALRGDQPRRTIMQTRRWRWWQRRGYVCPRPRRNCVQACSAT